MPKDEFDFEDPFELSGMAFFTEEDTTDDMAECFIEEFMRMGHNHNQILALFRNPHYLGPNMALEKRGELFVRELIAKVFARWGRPVDRPMPTHHASKSSDAPPPDYFQGPEAPQQTPAVTDPMGGPAPTINF